MQGVSVVSLWFVAVPLVRMRTILPDTLFYAEVTLNSTAVFTWRATTTDSPNLILLDRNTKILTHLHLLLIRFLTLEHTALEIWGSLRAMLLKTSVFCNVTQCRRVSSCRHLGGRIPGAFVDIGGLGGCLVKCSNRLCTRNTLVENSCKIFACNKNFSQYPPWRGGGAEFLFCLERQFLTTNLGSPLVTSQPT